MNGSGEVPDRRGIAGLLRRQNAEAGIAAHQFVIRSRIRDPAFFQEKNPVAMAYRRKAMGDENGGAFALSAGDGANQRLLGGAVERGGAFVQDKQARASVKGAGDAEALALASGDARAAFADGGVEAAGQGAREGGQLGGFERLAHSFAVDFGVGNAEGDIAPDGVVAEENGLGHIADLGLPLAAEAADVPPVHLDRAAIGVEQADDQIRQRGFSRSRRADERDRLADFDLQAGIDNRFARGVGVAIGHAAKDDSAVEARRVLVLVAGIFGCRGFEPRQVLEYRIDRHKRIAQVVESRDDSRHDAFQPHQSHAEQGDDGNGSDERALGARQGQGQRRHRGGGDRFEKRADAGGGQGLGERSAGICLQMPGELAGVIILARRDFRFLVSFEPFAESADQAGPGRLRLLGEGQRTRIGPPQIAATREAEQAQNQQRHPRFEPEKQPQHAQADGKITDQIEQRPQRVEADDFAFLMGVAPQFGRVAFQVEFAGSRQIGAHQAMAERRIAAKDKARTQPGAKDEHRVFRQIDGKQCGASDRREAHGIARIDQGGDPPAARGAGQAFGLDQNSQKRRNGADADRFERAFGHRQGGQSGERPPVARGEERVEAGERTPERGGRFVDHAGTAAASLAGEIRENPIPRILSEALSH
ncbi:MAG: hypothetical protein BWZ10_02083 [candidate division BRC1 bacterium ADurb.BinA364]|nr:MAG: hypothetical protein BWZ10_02083 [candidate division BRC1 bacterium ADurb.BinA364]